MNKPIGMACFSGTGNTRLMAGLLAEALRHRGATVDMLAIEDVLNSRGRWDTEPYERIGIGWPVHALDAPRIVYEFIRRLPPGGDKPAFTFRSAGDPFWNGGPTESIRQALAQRGYRVYREDLVIMPSNVFVAYSDALARKLYVRAEQRSAAIAAAILADEEHTFQSPPVQRAVARITNSLQGLGARLTGRWWRVTADCTLCDHCINQCPTGNIIRDLDRPAFGWDCLLCMRCVYLCPEQAIRPPFGLSFMVLKEGYSTKPMLDSTHDDPKAAPSAESRGYLGRLYRYLNEPPP